MTASVRERSRDALRTEIARAAVDLFVDHGFDGITVEELSHRLGISRATFFRYFGSKEDVVVVAVEGSGYRHAEALLAAARQSRSGSGDCFVRRSSPLRSPPIVTPIASESGSS